MTPSELADRLDEYESKGLMESLSTAMILNLPVIFKSLRFAADMEKLLKSGKSPVFHEMADGKVAIHFDRYTLKIESDVYSAARKAVKALEGENE